MPVVQIVLEPTCPAPRHTRRPTEIGIEPDDESTCPFVSITNFCSFGTQHAFWVCDGGFRQPRRQERAEAQTGTRKELTPSGRVARGRKGAHEEEATASGSGGRAAVGEGIRQEVSFRDRRGEERRSRTSFRGRSQLFIYHFMFGPDYRRRLPGLLDDRRRLQRAHPCTWPTMT